MIQLLRPSVPRQDMLQTILWRKAEEVAARVAAVPADEMRARALDMPPTRGFAAALEACAAEETSRTDAGATAQGGRSRGQAGGRRGTPCSRAG